MTHARFVSIIMAGGSGTRFWPVSTRALPKQFLPLAGDTPMLRETAERVLPVTPWDSLFVICGAHHAGNVRRILPELPEPNLILEPVARNSCPALALAGLAIRRRYPHQRVAVAALPSDHVIRDTNEFRACMHAALARAADAGCFVTLGIVPASAHTGFGYIERAERAFEGPPGGGGFRAVRFVEKPDLETARHYVSSGRYFWNAGMFFFRLDTLDDHVARLQPALHAAMHEIGRESAQEAPAGRLSAAAVARHFPRVPAISFDYAIMEHAAAVEVIPLDAGWNDLGSWPGIALVRPVDGAGNSGQGAVAAIEASGNVIYSTVVGHVTAVLGVDELVVVTTPQATLVLPKARAQDVRLIVEWLAEHGGEGWL